MPVHNRYRYSDLQKNYRNLNDNFEPDVKMNQQQQPVQQQQPIQQPVQQPVQQEIQQPVQQPVQQEIQPGQQEIQPGQQQAVQQQLVQEEQQPGQVVHTNIDMTEQENYDKKMTQYNLGRYKENLNYDDNYNPNEDIRRSYMKRPRPRYLTDTTYSNNYEIQPFVHSQKRRKTETPGMVQNYRVYRDNENNEMSHWSYHMRPSGDRVSEVPIDFNRPTGGRILNRPPITHHGLMDEAFENAGIYGGQIRQKLERLIQKHWNKLDGMFEKAVIKHGFKNYLPLARKLREITQANKGNMRNLGPKTRHHFRKQKQQREQRKEQQRKARQQMEEDERKRNDKRKKDGKPPVTTRSFVYKKRRSKNRRN